MPPPTQRQARLIWSALTGLALGVIVFLIALSVWGLGHVLRMLSPVLWPLAVAGVLAYLLDPVVDYLQRKGLSRTGAIISVFGIALIIVVGLVASVVPQLVRETTDLAARIPVYSKNLQRRAEKWLENPPDVLQRFIKGSTVTSTNAQSLGATNDAQPGVIDSNALPPISDTNTAMPPAETTSSPSSNAPSSAVRDSSKRGLTDALDKDTIQSAATWIAQAVPKVGSWIFGQVTRVASWFAALVALGLVPIYTFYLLLEKRGIESKWTDYLPVQQSGFKDELIFVIRSINSYLIAFFRGQVLVAICDGILYTIGFLIIGLPYAILIGAVSIVLTIIPFIGAIVTCVAALIIALVQYGDWLHPLLVLAVFAVVQTLEGLVISPKIMGDRVGLHPLTVIIAVMGGTTLLGGLLGGILAIPLTAALKVILSRYVWKKRGTK